jgi:uncharacterized repeat protein (TIGR01451 family)
MLFAVLLSACSEERNTLERSTQAVHDGAPPYWQGGTGPAVHYPPVAWPAEPAASECGATCGEWLPYTRFQNSLNDPRTKDPSNGGTSPQNHVNIASSCVDTTRPSIYYSLRKHATDPSKDVLMFRWRVAQDAHTYATGPSPSAFRSGDPWSSALWTVLFNLDGSGYRTLAAHINGSAGSPSAPIDTLAAIYGKIPTQSINYLDDPDNIKLLATQPTAFVDQGSERLLNFNNTLTPTPDWLKGAAETLWDYGTTRARLVVDRPCTEYFIDYQIPVAMLDATSQGGPKVTRSTPISMLFCTANSLNNPFQKDCALNRSWTANTNAPGPFGDFISFDQDKPYAQPLITAVTAIAPSTCAETYALSAKVQDALWVNAQETIEPSVKAVSFWYYHDGNGDGVSNDGSTWTKAVDGTLVPGKLNEFRASWDSRGLPRGSYLIGVQAVDDNTRVDDGMVPSGVDNRTFSYVTSDSLGQVYIGGAWKITQQHFPGHAPAMAPQANENWYGNPLVTGVQVAGTGVDVALNSCGIAPSIGMTADRPELTPGERVNLSITLSNPANSPFPVNVSSIVGQLPPGFSYVSGSTSGPFGSADPVISGTTLTWTFSSAVPISAGASATLTFGATASAVAGNYNAQSSAATSFGGVSSEPVPLTVYAARASLTQTPSRYQVKPDGSTPVTYTLTYANESSVTLSNATLTNPLPANVNFVGCTGGACALGGGQVTWQLGTLAPGAKGSVTFTVNVAPAFTATSLTNVANLQATVPGGSQLQRSSTSTITVEQPVPAFSLSMTSSAIRIAPGTPVTWTMTYANQGTGAATGSFLVDKLPDGFTFTSCSVTGSTHFTGCTNAAGTVTFHGADGAAGTGVTVGIGSSGSVTITATAAAAPFTYTNPAVNSATISASGGRGAAQAQASVGVTGQYCSNVYYFRRGVDNNLGTIRPASALPPTDTATYSTFISTTSSVFGTDQVVFRQEQPFAQDTTLSGLQLTIDFALGANQGGGRTRVLLENATTGQTIATSTDFSVTNSATPVWYQYAVTIPTPTAPAQPLRVLKGEQLRWVFQFRAGGGTRDITFYYDSVQNQSRSSFCAATSPASLTLSNTVDKTRIAGTVEKLTYTLRYTNAGGTSASNVVLSDVLPAGMTACEYSTNGSTWQACSAAASSPQRHDFNLGALASGASGTVFVRGDSPASPSLGQVLVNTASIVSTETPTPVSATASTSLSGSNQPMLVITGGADKSLVGPGEVVSYTFTVKNVGTGPATNVAVSNPLPVATPWYEYVPGSITGGTSRSVAGNTLSWTLGSLAVDATATLTFQMVTPATGLPSGQTTRDDVATLSDSSYCIGAAMPASCTSNTVTVIVDGKANLTLSSSGTPATVAPGQVIDYTLTVGSVGSSTATAVVLRDTLPRYTRFVDTVPAGSGSYDAVRNQVVFNLGDLASGQTAQRGVRVRVVEGSLPGGTTLLENVSLVSASNAQLRTSTVQTSAVAEPKMSLVSTGPSSLPGPAARLAASVSGAVTLQVNNAALLEVGGYLLVNGTVAQVTDIAGTTVRVSSPVTASAGAPLWRSAGYTLSFANTGNATAESVVVTGALPAGWLYVTSRPSATAAPGVGTTGNVSWNLGGVAAGEVSSLQIVAIPTLTATLPSTVADSRSCTSAATSGCSDSVTTTVGGLSASKRTTTPVVTVGGSASYTIILENSLDTPVTGVSVTDILPSGFSYRPGSSTPEPTVNQGQPTWSALTVPAAGQLELTFSVNVDALTGTATYDNALSVVAPNGVGVTPFDPLGTTAEDVTVVGNGSFVAAGYVFRDRPTLGAMDDGDTGLANVVVNINDSSPTPYSIQTDDFGYFRRILPAGTWAVSIPTTDASNQQVLNGLTLYNTYSTPVAITGSNPAATSIRFGYVPTVNATYTVSTQVAAGQGSFSPGSATVAHSETTSFTVTPDVGYSLKSVTGCGGSLVGNVYTTGAITSACTVTATFELKTYTVSTQVTEGLGSFSPGSATVKHGDTTSFTVTPATGYSVKSVTGCGGSLSGTTYTTAAVTADCTVTASFILNEYTVSTQVAAGQGSFSPTSATVAHGDTTSFTVTPATGYSVQSVTGCGGSLSGTTYTTAAVTADCTVTATFVLNEYTVSTQVAAGQGSFSPGSATVAHGNTASFTVTPATGYSVQSVTGCGGTLSGTTYTTASVTADCTVTATFVLKNVPDAVDDAVTVAEDSSATVVNVLANDSTGQLTVTAVTQPTSGGLVTLEGGVVRFTPAPDFHGTVTFTYTVSDGNGGTDTATVTVTVMPVNDPPTGVADTYSVPANSPATTLNVLNNDSSAPDTNEQLTVESVTQPTSGGTVSVAPNGTGVVFTPTPGFTGEVTFTYTVSDGNGGTATATVTVKVGLQDSDNDGVDDKDEIELGLDPNDPDADDDGILDNEDGLTDTDGDGMIDALDPDSDNDGLNDGTERGVTASMTLPGTDRSSPNFQPDSDPSTTTDPRNPDTDNDGLKDGTEDANHDGRVDDTESDPNDPDTDHGGLKDGEEVNEGGNPRDYTDDLVVAGRGCSSTGSGTLLPLLALLALPLLRRRQALRGPAMGWGVLGLLAAVFVSAPASAQDASQASQSIDVQQYKPGPSSLDVLNLQSSQVRKHLEWNLGLSFNYARNPLNFLRPRTDDFVYAVVKNQLTFDLMGSIALFDRYELGVALPITSQGSGPAASVSPLLSDGLQATGVGDLRLIPKANLLSLDNGLRLGIAVPLLLPTSGGKEFMGRKGVAAMPRVLGEWVFNDQGARVLANVGVNLQPEARFYNLNVGNEFAYGVGAEVPFQVNQHRLAAEASLVGALGLKQASTEERPLEVLGAVKYHFTDKLAAHVGGGPGLTRGYGTPGFRLFAGVVWTEATRAVPARLEPPPAAPSCPQGPEDQDGFQDEDGCADPDNDGDGLPDDKDGCPNQPETKNGFQDEDGCADELPPPPPVDSDGDGLTDDKDRCPRVAEDKDGFQDEDGCPDPDNDKDGVVDAADKCPSEPETINGVKDEDGCPDKGKEKVRVEGGKILILDKVYFATNKDVILARSFPLLRQVGQVLRANPELLKVRVEGHTDSQSSDAFNLDLSQRRANSVRKHLIQKEGVAAERLESVGYGESKPVDTNKTAKGRENNRRVEFIILEVEKETP